MTLIQALRERLLSQPPLTALVGTRVYAMRLPQDTPLPAVRIQEVDRLGSQQLRGTVNLHVARVQVDAVEGETNGPAPYASAHAVADAVRGAIVGGEFTGLEGFVGVLSGIRVRGIGVVDQRERFETEVRQVSVQVDFLVWFNE